MLTLLLHNNNNNNAWILIGGVLGSMMNFNNELDQTNIVMPERMPTKWVVALQELL